MLFGHVQVGLQNSAGGLTMLVRQKQGRPVMTPAPNQNVDDPSPTTGRPSFLELCMKIATVEARRPNDEDHRIRGSLATCGVEHLTRAAPVAGHISHATTPVATHRPLTVAITAYGSKPFRSAVEVVVLSPVPR